MTPTVVFTIGHSDRTATDFVDLLRRHAIELVADVRTVPRSAHNPQFGADLLEPLLAENGIRYEHHAALGGFRRPMPDSPNAGWRNERFRGYADYMGTPEFAAAVDELAEEASVAVTAIMCAEAVPWRCHRSLIADALVVRGFEVRHIIGSGEPRLHQLHDFARVEGTTIRYPAE